MKDEKTTTQTRYELPKQANHWREKKLYEKNVTTINVMPNEGEFKSEKDMWRIVAQIKEMRNFTLNLKFNIFWICFSLTNHRSIKYIMLSTSIKLMKIIKTVYTINWDAKPIYRCLFDNRKLIHDSSSLILNFALTTHFILIIFIYFIWQKVICWL